MSKFDFELLKENVSNPFQHKIESGLDLVSMASYFQSSFDIPHSLMQNVLSTAVFKWQASSGKKVEQILLQGNNEYIHSIGEIFEQTYFTLEPALINIENDKGWLLEKIEMLFLELVGGEVAV